MLRIIVLAAALALQGALPQEAVGDVSGLVRDVDGSVLPGATVTAQIGNERRVASTDSRGHYELRHLPVGTYRFTAELSGFEPLARSATVISRTIVGVDFDLKILEQRFVDPVWTFIEPFVGSDAISCGALQRNATVAELKQSLACGLRAIREGLSFWTVREWTGIDSRLAHGLLGRRNGTMFVFDYDSAPCGGPSCVPRFSIERCPSPAVTGGGIEMRFSCSPGALGLKPEALVYSLSTASGSTRAARREGR